MEEPPKKRKLPEPPTREPTEWEPLGGGVLKSVLLLLLLGVACFFVLRFLENEFGRRNARLLFAGTVVFCIAVRWTFLYLRDRHWSKRVLREKQWKCTHCGYDLRGTPDRCPECGTPSPFGQWLAKSPLDRAIYTGDLRPRKPGEELPPQPDPPVEVVEKVWPEFNSYVPRDPPSAEQDEPPKNSQ